MSCPMAFRLKDWTEHQFVVITLHLRPASIGTGTALVFFIFSLHTCPASRPEPAFHTPNLFGGRYVPRPSPRYTVHRG